MLVAAKDKMDLAVNIAIGSTPRSPCSWRRCWCWSRSCSGPIRWRSCSTATNSGALLFAVLIANLVTQEGESNWFEGVQLLALYAVLGLVFYFA